MKPWQIKIANFYFKLTEKFTVIEWIVIFVTISYITWIIIK